MTERLTFTQHELDNFHGAMQDAEGPAAGQSTELAERGADVTASLLRAASLLLLNAPEVLDDELHRSIDEAADTAIGVLAGALADIDADLLAKSVARIDIHTTGTS